MRWIVLATEDELSEAIALRILADFPALSVTQCLRRGGNGYLRSRMRSFCEIAERHPVLVVTDLDRNVCPQALRTEWLRHLRPPDGLLLRVAVRTIESWLLADHEAVVTLLGRSAPNRLPVQPDLDADPKGRLLLLAKRASKDVRLDLLPAPGAMTSRGPGYNQRLCALVRQAWVPDRAASRSPSLRRTIGRIRELAGAASA